MYIIKPQDIYARWRVMIYKGGLPTLMICTALCAAMICQACGLDKKSDRIRTCGIDVPNVVRSHRPSFTL